MRIAESLYDTERNDCHAWLEEDYTTKKEIWQIYYKKHSGRPRIAYDDAVEEAIYASAG